MSIIGPVSNGILGAVNDVNYLGTNHPSPVLKAINESTINRNVTINRVSCSKVMLE